MQGGVLQSMLLKAFTKCCGQTDSYVAIKLWHDLFHSPNALQCTMEKCVCLIEIPFASAKEQRIHYVHVQWHIATDAREPFGKLCFGGAGPWGEE